MSAVNLMSIVPPTRDLDIRLAQPQETGLVLSLVEELLAELGDEGEEFTGIDRERLLAQLEAQGRLAARPEAEDRLAARPEAEPDPDHPDATARFLAFVAHDERGEPVGVLTLSTAFAIYAGGEYGIIEEMYVRPEHRGRGVGRKLVKAAIALAHQRGWHRLEVTGPAAAGPGGTSPGPAAAGPAAARPETGPFAALVDQQATGLEGASASPGRAVRFYEQLGFAYCGPKLRALVDGSGREGWAPGSPLGGGEVETDL